MTKVGRERALARTLFQDILLGMGEGPPQREEVGIRWSSQSRVGIKQTAPHRLFDPFRLDPEKVRYLDHDSGPLRGPVRRCACYGSYALVACYCGPLAALLRSYCGPIAALLRPYCGPIAALLRPEPVRQNPGALWARQALHEI